MDADSHGKAIGRTNPGRLAFKPRFWLGLIALPVLALGLARLRFDIEVLNLLPSEARAVEGLKLYQQNFSNARELIVTVRAPNAPMAEAAARAVAVQLRKATGLVTEASWAPPWLEHPADAAALAAYCWFNQPPSVFGALTNRLATTNALETLATTRERLTTSFSPGELARLTHDPFGLLELPGNAGLSGMSDPETNPFSSPDGTFRLVFTQSVSDLRDYRECKLWLQAVQSEVATARRLGQIPPEVVIRYTGRPVFVAEISGGMQRDITGSVIGTVLIIAGLFYWAHRTWRPLLWLLALLTLVLGATVAVGGLIFGSLNVVSTGFAAILLGLAVDYGLVVYQEYQTDPAQTPSEVRRAVAPSVAWSALTTCGAFLVLNFGGLPGLGQLGSLVGIGIAIAAVVMLYFYLPPLARSANRKDHAVASSGLADLPSASPAGRFSRMALNRPIMPTVITVVVLLTASGAIAWRPPVLEHGPDALRPRHSSAYATLDEIRREMKQEKEPLWLVVAGENEQLVADRLAAIAPKLEEAKSAGQIAGYTFPAALWPNPAWQASNRPTARALVSQFVPLRKAALARGFTHEGLAATATIFQTWNRAADSPRLFWPTNAVGKWVFSRFTAETNGQQLALGLIYPATDRRTAPGASSWAANLPQEGVWLAGWDLLGAAVLDVVERDLWRVLAPMVCLLITCLAFAFRRALEVWLSLAALSLSALLLLAVMAVAGWAWNLMNLMAIPLLLGAGIDYSIHMLLAMRRHQGDARRARRSTGRALLLCAATTIAGFGSLAWSSNAGLGSLGQVCAAGVAVTFSTAVYLLPAWWNLAGGAGFPAPGRASSAPAKPSSLYRPELWQLGRWIGRALPSGLVHPLSRILAAVYSRLQSARREVVVANLLPVAGNDRIAAGGLARQVFRQFSDKLVDLWRYESGLPVEDLVANVNGWDHFTAAQQRGHGILLLTIHLGNWELGAALLASRGIRLTVVTLEEPSEGLTDLRRASRTQRGVETVVVGTDPFAFVELIRRLEEGGVVALLVDRPPQSSAAVVQLFDRRFLASMAPAELARATGCALLPVCLPRVGPGYQVQVLPEIGYDRAALRSRAAREELTQRIISAFEAAIRQHADQWYHFVPIWPKSPPTTNHA